MTVIPRQCCILLQAKFPHFWDGAPPEKVTAPVEEILVSSPVSPIRAPDNYCLMLKFTLISCSLLCSILTVPGQRTSTAVSPAITTPTPAPAKRPIRPGDLYRLPAVRRPVPRNQPPLLPTGPLRPLAWLVQQISWPTRTLNPRAALRDVP
jgi:hypothetical protein